MMNKKRNAAVVVVALLMCLNSVSASICSDEGGTCKDVKQCSSTTVTKLCPGAANIQCCYPGQGQKCTVSRVGSGTCLVQGRQACSGTFYSGACPGPAKVKCCVKPSTTTSWTTRVTIPPKRNTGLTALKQSTLTTYFGKPCASPSTSCANKNLAAKLKQNLRSKSDSASYAVIPFSPNMLKPAMDALALIFTKVKAEQPALYDVVKTAGSLCCRPIKLASGGLSSSLSLHSWGVALDLTIGTKPADRGLDGKTYRGIIALAPYFEAEGFYWGAAFSDAMHFEVSSQKFDAWKKGGMLT